MTARPTNIRWRVFFLLALSSFVSYVLRSNISIAAPTMINELALSEIQWGWVLAAFTAGYAIFQIPGGIFGDKFGPRKALTTIAVLWGITLVFTIVIPGPKVASTGVIVATLIIIRFIVGIVHAPIFPVQNTAISRWFPAGRWALPIGLSSIALTLGFAAAAPALGWLMVQFGWRIAFLILAPLGFIVAGLWWWYARDYPHQHAAVNSAELTLIGAARGDFKNRQVSSPNWLELLKNRNILLLTLSYACMSFLFYEVFNWFVYYLVEIREFDMRTAGYVTSSQWLAGAAGAALGGWFCDRLCARIGIRWGIRWPIIIGLLGSAVFLIAGAFHSNPMIAVAMLGLCFLFNQLTDGAYWAASIAIGGDSSGTAGGILNTGSNTIGVLSAVLVPWLAHAFGWDFALASGAIFALVGALLLLFVRADEPASLPAGD